MMGAPELSNKYFVDIGLAIASKHSENFRQYMPKSLTSPIFLNETCQEDIIKIIDGLKSGKAVGYNQIPSYFMKIIKYKVSTVLADFFNCSLSLGIFPYSLLLIIDQSTFFFVFPKYLKNLSKLD